MLHRYSWLPYQQQISILHTTYALSLSSEQACTHTVTCGTRGMCSPCHQQWVQHNHGGYPCSTGFEAYNHTTHPCSPVTYRLPAKTIFVCAHNHHSSTPMNDEQPPLDADAQVEIILVNAAEAPTPVTTACYNAIKHSEQ